jgi:hypothetical protein
MLRGFRVLAFLLGSLLACDEPARVKGPPPLPVIPATSEAQASRTTAGAPRKAKSRDDSAARRTAGATKERSKAASGQEATADKPRAANKPTAPPSAGKEPAAGPARATSPAPAAPPSKAAAAKPRTKVVVPRTEHVRADISDALQADLDADPRMQAWLDKVMAVIDGCHAKNRSAVGTVQGSLTMHESARPSFALGSISPQLGGVVSCATGQLVRIKMPLFTGREGARHTVRVNFE